MEHLLKKTTYHNWLKKKKKKTPEILVNLLPLKKLIQQLKTSPQINPQAQMVVLEHSNKCSRNRVPQDIYFRI